VHRLGGFLEGFSFASGGVSTKVCCHHGWCSGEEGGLEGFGEPWHRTATPQLPPSSSWGMHLGGDGWRDGEGRRGAPASGDGSSPAGADVPAPACERAGWLEEKFTVQAEEQLSVPDEVKLWGCSERAFLRRTAPVQAGADLLGRCRAGLREIGSIFRKQPRCRRWRAS